MPPVDVRRADEMGAADDERLTARPRGLGRVRGLPGIRPGTLLTGADARTTVVTCGDGVLERRERRPLGGRRGEDSLRGIGGCDGALPAALCDPAVRTTGTGTGWAAAAARS